MPELFPKPSDFGTDRVTGRDGLQRPLLGTDALNKMLEAVPRVITGDGAELKKFGDRWIVEVRENTAYRADETEYFVVMEEHEEYLTCVVFGYTSTQQQYDETLGDIYTAQGLTAYPICVAKPQWLQQTAWTNPPSVVVIDGVTLTGEYIGVNQRVLRLANLGAVGEPLPYRQPVRLQEIDPPYLVGSVILAKSGPTGLQYNDPDTGFPETIIWTDLNDAGRTWRDNSQPQVVTIKNGTPVDGYFDAVWNLRDNANRVFEEQTPIWVRDLNSASSLTVDRQYKAVFGGLEEGPGSVERPLFFVESVASVPLSKVSVYGPVIHNASINTDITCHHQLGRITIHLPTISGTDGGSIVVRTYVTVATTEWNPVVVDCPLGTVDDFSFILLAAKAVKGTFGAYYQRGMLLSMTFRHVQNGEWRTDTDVKWGVVVIDAPLPGDQIAVAKDDIHWPIYHGDATAGPGNYLVLQPPLPLAYSETFGDGIATVFVINHKLRTLAVTVQCYSPPVVFPVSQGILLDPQPEVSLYDEGNVILTFLSPPASGTRVVVIG